MSGSFSLKPLWRPRAGLRFEIMLNMGLVLAVAIAMVGVTVYSITARSLVDVEARKAREVMVVIQSSLSMFLPVAGNNRNPKQRNRSTAELKALVIEIVETTGLKDLAIIDSNLKVIAAFPRNSSNDFLGDEIIMAMLQSTIPEPYIPEVESGFLGRELDTLPVYAPIMLRGKVVGALKATFSLTDLKRKITLAQQMLITFLFINTAVIVVFGIVLLSRVLIRPLDKLVKATEIMASGDLQHRVEIKEHNEMGRLAKSFNNMAERILKSQEELKLNISDLAKVNKTLEKTRNELIYSEKLASVGRLAQGVAHEIGNPLSAVLGYLSFLEKSESLGDTEIDFLKRCDSELTRINTIIKELLDYSRPSDQTELQDMDPVEALDAAISLLKGQKKFENINLERKIEGKTGMVRADKNKLMQVIINLCLNAADAIGEDGTVILGANQTKYDDGSMPESGFTDYLEVGAMQEKLKPGDEVLEIFVEDFGPGIKPDEISAIFDPFFTTKEPGKGMGLGLAICSRIIEGFGARLKVETALGKGTRFTIIFKPLR